MAEDMMLTDKQIETIDRFVAEHHNVEIVHVFKAGADKRSCSLSLFGIVDDGCMGAGNKDFKFLACFEHKQSANERVKEAEERVQERIESNKAWDESMAEMYRREDEYWSKAG